MVFAWALYRDRLQAANSGLMVFVFRNASGESRLAERVSSATGAADAIGVHNGGDYQSAEEHQSCCNHQ